MGSESFRPHFSFILMIQIVLQIQQDIETVYEKIHHGGHDKSGYHVKRGMLFGEHRRKDNRNAEHERAVSDSFMLCEMPAFCDGKMAAEGIIYVNARPKVCRCIGAVNHGDKFCENIVSRENERPQTVPVWPQCGNEQKNGHSRKQKSTAFIIIVFVLKEEKSDGGRDIKKPQQIGHDEYFTKRNVVIQRDMNELIMFYGLFQMAEPYHIDRRINQERNGMLIFMEKSFHASSNTFLSLRCADTIYETYHSRLYTKVKITFV